MVDRAAPRLLAASVLLQVWSGRSMDDALEDALGRCPADQRPLVQEMSFGAVRHGHRMQAVVDRLLSSPLKERHQDVEALLFIGLYQLMFMRIPAHAIVSETVQAGKNLRRPWAGGLINGVLRAFLRDRDNLLPLVDEEPAVRLSHPQWLVDRIRAAWPDRWEAILAAANERPPLALRVNQARTTKGDYLQRLTEASMPARPIPGVPTGLVLDRAVDVRELPGFAEGLVSVQDGGAQLAARLLDAQPGERVLDACAAPGGKTCHILERCPEGLDLTAMDLEQRRLDRVRENLTRLGLRANLAASDAANPAGAWAERPYDRILLDVPCSATGVIRRHPDIKWLRRDEDIATLAELQGRILEAQWGLLRPGGRLVYATCSLLPEENEGRIQAFLAGRTDAREVPIEALMDAGWGHARAHGRQTLPGEATMDGFYYCVLEKAL